MEKKNLNCYFRVNHFRCGLILCGKIGSIMRCSPEVKDLSYRKNKNIFSIYRMVYKYCIYEYSFLKKSYIYIRQMLTCALSI